MVFFDIHRRMLTNGEAEILLTKSEAACLQLLVAHPDSPVSREALQESGWTENGVVVTEASVRVTLHHLRKNLIMAGVPASALTTMLRKGYRLESGHVHQSTEAESMQSVPPLAGVTASSECSCFPSIQQRGGWRYLTVILLLSLAILLGIGTGMLRVKDFITSVEYVALNPKDNIHIFTAPGSEHMGDNAAALIQEMFTKKYIPAQNEYWVYIHNTSFKQRFSALICSLPLIENKNTCFTLNLLISDG